MTTRTGALAQVTACIFALATPAAAGSLGDPIVEAPISVGSEEEWQGFRLGLTYNSEIASNTYATSEEVPFIDGSNTGHDGLGGFLGFDFQRGNLVYGLEIQSMPRDNPVQGFPTRSHKDMHSVRGRIGYANSKTLFYGVLGLARSEFDDAGSIIDMNGYVAGLGVERKIGKNTFVGFGIDHYVLTGERLANAVEAEHTVAQLRVGFTF